MADKGGYIGRNPGDSAVIIARQNYTPTGIQTDFTFNSGYTPGYVDVYLNGVRLIDVQDYTASAGNTVGLTSAAISGDIVEVIAYKAFNVGNVSDATNNFTVGGNLVVSGDTNVSGSSTFVDVNISGATTASGASYLSNVTEFVSSGIATVSNTTDSTSTTTGALQVRGGVGVALSMHVGGNLSVGGTVTYEDVTNVDAIGIITAQSGVNIVGGGLTVTGVGTFFGDVSIADKIVHLGDTDTAIRFPGTDIFTIETGGSERVRVDSAGLKIPDKLIHFGDTDTAIRFPAADTISAETGGSERLRVDSGGRLLVGYNATHEVQSVNVRLQVSGTSFANSGISQQRYSADGSGPTIFLSKSRNNTEASHTILQDGDEFGKLRFYGSDGVDFDNYGAAIVAKVDGVVGINSMPGKIEFHTSAAGLGTATKRLTVTSTGRIIQHSNNEDIDMDSTASGQLKLDGNGWNAAISLNDEAMNIYHNSSSRAIIFGTNETEKVRITNSGSVGIGTTDPSWGIGGGLMVGGGASSHGITIFTGSSNSGDLAFADETSGTGRYRGLIRYDHDDNSFLFRTNSDERIRITSSGMVGMGTATPATLLHTYHATLNEVARFESGDATCYISFRDSASNATATSRPILGAKTDDMFFQTGGSEKFRITSGGQLQAIGAADVRLTLGSSGTAGTNDSVHVRADSANLLLMNASGGMTKFENNGSERLRITSGGQVNIGGDYTQTTRQLGVVSSGEQVASFEYTGADTDGSEVRLYHNSSSPADDDVLGFIQFVGKNSADEVTLYSGISAHSRDVTDGTENGSLSFYTRKNGSWAVNLDIMESGDVEICRANTRQIIGGFGAITTGGTTDWDDSTNARAGNGHTLLLGSATNGPGGSYYHVFTYEYNSNDGTGNMTQMGIPYNSTTMVLRTRYNGTWSAWTSVSFS